MKIFFPDVIFDMGVGALAAAFHARKWDIDQGSHVSNICIGMQAFVIASIGDRLLRLIFLKQPVKQFNVSLWESIKGPILEESFYSAILLTEKLKWMVLRLPTSLLLGMTTMRAFGASPAVETIGGLALTVLREGVLRGVPKHISFPVLIAMDSVVFGINEVCPPKNSSLPFPKYKSVWFYRVISSVVFRALARVSVSRGGVASPFVQHILFNYSRFLSRSDQIKIG